MPVTLITVPCALCGADEPEVMASGRDFEYHTTPETFSYVRCKKCGHWYLNPRPSVSDLNVIYPSNYYAFTTGMNPIVQKCRSFWEKKKVEGYSRMIGAGARRILDVGCGEGRFLSILKEYGPKDWQLCGLDFDEAAVQKCRERGFEAVARRVEDFIEGNGTFDAVIMLQLIEHVEDPALIARRVFELLKPGGYFIIETPNIDSLDFKLFKKSHWGHFHFPRHWHLFSTLSLHRMLRSAGFEIAETSYLLSVSGWIISVHNALLDRGCPKPMVQFFSFQNPLLLPLVVLGDTLRAKLGFQTSNQRVVARKP
ncbi:MAG: class I SAM-dependent methyltransferase [Candidatus Omnitrophica bacterium]|nr:class I SAM-dependent methyltransferase [Candidatus Omnitrophota bacterium]